MARVNLQNVTLSFGERKILDDVTFVISSPDKVALTGPNGSGKTTLMRVLCRQFVPDGGEIIEEKGTRVSYLPQSGVVLSDTTVHEEAERAFSRHHEVVGEMEGIEAEFLGLEESDGRTQQLLSRYGMLQERLVREGYFARDEEIHRVLTGLGFGSEQFGDRCREFSAGWQMRIALARVLLERPDILLLDEPTNYLDLEAREWLEEFLDSFRGAVFVVSHDRYFLDRVVSSVVEIYGGRLSTYRGNFSEYERKRERELAETLQRYERQQEEIAKTESFIRKFQANSSKAKLVQSRMKYLERMERIEVPPVFSKMHFSFPEPPRSGAVAVTLQNIGKSYGDKAVLKDVHVELSRGDKLVVVGPNGAGKTTLLRIMVGTTTADVGSIRYGKDVKIGYYSEDDALPREGDSQGGPTAWTGDTSEDAAGGSVLDGLERVAPTDLFPRLRNLLGAFLFRGDDVFKPVSVLSGGERSRFALLKLLLHPVKLLILDEPTNHLDIASQEVLLDALKSFAGTIVFVSHDRFFIQSLATKVLEMRDGQARLHVGDYEYYLWRKRQETEGETAGAFRVVGPAEPIGSFHGRYSYDQEKKRKGVLRKLEREETELLERLDKLEKDRGMLEREMAKQEVYTRGDRMRTVKEQIVVNQREEQRLLGSWEHVHEKLRGLREEGE